MSVTRQAFHIDPLPFLVVPYPNFLLCLRMMFSVVRALLINVFAVGLLISVLGGPLIFPSSIFPTLHI